jgi:hypothetical protein
MRRPQVFDYGLVWNSKQATAKIKLGHWGLKQVSTQIPVLAEIGHSQKQNRPLPQLAGSRLSHHIASTTKWGAYVLDGFYKARFTKSDGETVLGLITLTNGKLFGGNSDFMFSGVYSQSGPDLSADIQISQLSSDRTSGIFRVGGSLNLVGRGGLQNIMCECHSPQSPTDRMQAVLERVPFWSVPKEKPAG